MDINDEDSLYRRIHPNFYVIKENRIASGAFKDYETSVDLARLCTPQKALEGYDNHHLAELKAKIPRERGQEVRHDPKPKNPAHSLIIGKKTLSISRYLAKNSILIIKRND